jgi:hypothetical protein
MGKQVARQLGLPIPTGSAYAGKTIILATKHGKERAISNAFRRHLGAEIEVADIDTDKLGTFSGEIEREGNPIEVALRKAKLGIRSTGLGRGLANEGSFGPHPAVPFSNVDLEVLAFVDEELEIEVIERIQSLKTNLAYCTPRAGEDIKAFLESMHFGSHALVVRPNDGDKYSTLFKGIQKVSDLENAIRKCAQLSPDGKAHVETDMRAHLNPTRMKVIRKLGYQMAKRLSTRCSECFAPGWGIVDVERGLPCAWCGAPTPLVWKEIYRCAACEHEEREKRADGKESAEAKNCPECNP